MRKTTTEFNAVVGEIFPGLTVVTTWDEDPGQPSLKIKKGDTLLEVTQLSCGEQEVLSLALNLHVNRDSQDVILIDEPEIHLNWHLEQNLFRYLRGFAEGNGPQLIVATHSRIVFQPDWLADTRFLSWETDSVSVSNRPSETLRERMAGEALQLVGLGDFPIATFFVEDSMHVEVLTEIASRLDRKISVVPVGNSANVKSLYRLSVGEGGWANAYFLLDGDGQGNPFPQSPEEPSLGPLLHRKLLNRPSALLLRHGLDCRAVSKPGHLGAEDQA